MIHPEFSGYRSDRLRTSDIVLLDRVPAAATEHIHLDALFLGIRRNGQPQAKTYRHDYSRQPSVHSTPFVQSEPYSKAGTELGQLENERISHGFNGFSGFQSVQSVKSVADPSCNRQ